MLMVGSRTDLIIKYCVYISTVFSNGAAEREQLSSYLKREKCTANNDMVAKHILINYNKALWGIREQSNNTSLAILSIIHYVIRANLYLIPETVRSSLQFALISRCEKLPVVFIINTPSSYLQCESTVKKISAVYFKNFPANNAKYISNCTLNSQLWGVSVRCKIMHQETECP